MKTPKVQLQKHLLDPKVQQTICCSMTNPSTKTGKSCYHYGAIWDLYCQVQNPKKLEDLRRPTLVNSSCFVVVCLKLRHFQKIKSKAAKIQTLATRHQVNYESIKYSTCLTTKTRHTCMKYQKVKKLTVDACSTSPWASHLRQYVPNVPKTDVQASRKSAHCAPEANLKDTPRKHRIGNGYF